MNISVKEVIESIQRYHSLLGDFYSAEKGKIHNSRSINLLDFLRRSERYQEMFINQLKLHIDKHMQLRTVNLPEHTLYNIRFDLQDAEFENSRETFTNIMKFGLRNDVYLIEICKEISANPDYDELKPIFSELCKMTNNEMRNLYTYTYMFAC